MLGGPSQRGGPVLVTIDQSLGAPKLVLVFGFNGKEMDDLWEYSIQKKEWKQIQGIPNFGKFVLETS